MTTTPEQQEFLTDRRRFAMLTTITGGGRPITLPVWYEWDGSAVSMFCSIESKKLVRIAGNPQISVLVVNDRDEPEYWVAFDGEAIIEENGGFELAERMAGNYWDLDDAGRAEQLETWREFKDVGFRKIVLTPDRIRSMPPE